MVKGFAHGFFHDGGLVAKAAKVAFPHPFDEIAFERYIDVGLLSGNWWTGERRWELVVEVENDWGELLGTLRDLLNLQARYKWAVFYQRDPPAETAALAEAVQKVRELFNRDGFVESPNTAYEILVLPDSLLPKGH